MRIKTITAGFGVTINLGGYESARIDLAYTAELSEADDPDDVRRQLGERVQAEILAEGLAVRQRLGASAWAGASPEPDKPQEFNPRPKTLNDLITPKQLWRLRSLAREKGIEIETIAQSRFDLALEEISKAAASKLIDELQSAPEVLVAEAPEVLDTPF